jgi:hypothetical protein
MRFEFLLRDGGRHYAGFYIAPELLDGGTNASGRGRGRGRGQRGGQRSKNVKLQARGTSGQNNSGILNLLCWSAAVAFEPIAKRASSVLLTSGTLQPMNLLQTEFFAQIPPQPASTMSVDEIRAVGGALSPKSAKAFETEEQKAGPDSEERRTFLQFSAPHFDSVANNLLNLFVSEAPVPGAPPGSSVSLQGSYQQRSDPSYLRALGGTILQLAHIVRDSSHLLMLRSLFARLRWIVRCLLGCSFISLPPLCSKRL